jgi:hypothetical protein
LIGARFSSHQKLQSLSDEQLIDVELKTIERLEATIDHAIKRLGQMKAMKQVMSSANLQLYARDIITLPEFNLPTSIKVISIELGFGRKKTGARHFRASRIVLTQSRAVKIAGQRDVERWIDMP